VVVSLTSKLKFMEDWPMPGTFYYCNLKRGMRMLTRNASVRTCKGSRFSVSAFGPGAVCTTINEDTLRILKEFSR